MTFVVGPRIERVKGFVSAGYKFIFIGTWEENIYGPHDVQLFNIFYLSRVCLQT